jgi:hypothetical protein
VVGPCLKWWGNVRGDGYGLAYSPSQGYTTVAHRVIWEECFGFIPDGLHVLHLCDNPTCVNPEHLVLGTHQDNNLDRTLKGRSVSLKGVDNPNAKVSNEDVKAMRELHRQGMSYCKIARLYGMHPSNVSKIVRRKAYRNTP